ncbi:class I SAM-dependent methyltransferase [Glutamicibacter sp. PS]|uniref:class I SAM-dependent methyltransferase n=1 Tax=Glutamicibacter sp. PS TaxID=3075634 RepID=UPI00283E4573|nr:class I SAM-dependent methyltransferase [Glutamicibacter sp. PS]MDR4533400.1 class I SAM-dependent methyltransferase [Glutamicibacter sp. PS]
MAEIPPLPRQAFGLSAAQRTHHSAAFLAGADQYDKVRPRYPEAAVDFAVEGLTGPAADIGCGSGIFTAQLVARGLQVTAVDPSQDMLDVLAKRCADVALVRAGGESTGLQERSFELISYAQAWHWVDAHDASAEAARLLVPGGRLVLLWNQLDVQVPWVHRLARIMHAGDVHRPELPPSLGAEFTGLEQGLWHWEWTLTLGDVVELTKSRSYYRRATESTRKKVETNLHWYWCEHLGHDVDEPVAVPHLSHAWRAWCREIPGC